MPSPRRPDPRWIVGALAVGAMGCSAPVGGGEIDDDAGPPVFAEDWQVSAVVGVTVDAALAASVAALTVTVEAPVGGETIERRWSRADGDPPLPLEIAIPKLPEGSDIAATATAWASDGRRLVSRRMATSSRAGRRLLLPLWLNDECVAADDEPNVSCPDQTCAGGLCVNPRIKPELLPDHRPHWHLGDQVCGAHPPQVQLGGPEAPFQALGPEDQLVAEPGSQGLAHVFLSVEMRGLSPESMTVLTGLVPETGQELAPTWFDRAYEQVDGGCKLWDLRMVLPLTWNTTVQLGATVIEPMGNAEHHHVQLYVAGPKQ